MATASKRTAAHPEGTTRPVPPLENGDRLTRAEFERRYDAMPEVKKAELIEGVVHMPSPVRLRKHGQPHADLITWVGHTGPIRRASRSSTTPASGSTWTTCRSPTC